MDDGRTRRRLLLSLATAAGVSGCAGFGNGDDVPSTDQTGTQTGPRTEGSPTATPTATESPTATPSAAPGPVAPSEPWPMVGRGPRNRAALPSAALGDGGPTVEWSTALPKTYQNQVAVADDAVIVPTYVETVAIEADTGSVRWRAPVGGSVPPAVSDGTVVVTDTDGVYGLDLATGEQRWRDDSIYEFLTPPTVAHGRAYFGADGAIIALRVADGEQVLRRPTDRAVSNRVTVSQQRAFAVDQLGRLWAFHPLDGQVDWRIEFDAEPGTGYSPPVVADGKVVVGVEPGRVEAVSVENGIPRWTASGFDHLLYPPAVGHGNVYVSDFGGGLTALSLADGTRDWTIQADQTLLQPVVAGETVVASMREVPATDGTSGIVGASPAGARRWMRSGGPTGWAPTPTRDGILVPRSTDDGPDLAFLSG